MNLCSFVAAQNGCEGLQRNPNDVVLWLLGDTTTAIIVLVVEAIAWAAIHAFAPSRKE